MLEDHESTFFSRLTGNSPCLPGNGTVEFILVLIISILATATGLSVLRTAYRLTLHPLANVPGPFWGKVSDWRTVALCYGGDRHLHTLRDHEKYGSVVRAAPNTLVFNTASALHAIYSRGAPVKKSDWYFYLDAAAGAPSIMSEIDDGLHGFRRRNMAQAFSERAVRSAEEYVRIICDKLVSGLDQAASDGKVAVEGKAGGTKGWSLPTKLSDWATWYGFDVVGSLAFGSSFDCLSRPANRYVPALLVGTSKWIYAVGYLPFAILVYPFLGTRAMDLFGPSAAENLAFTNMANDRLAERMALEERLPEKGQDADADTDDPADNPAARKDTFHYLFRARDPVTGRGFTTEQLQADSGLLIAAGGDGIAIVVCATLFYLLRHPATLARAAAEVRAAFPSEADIRSPKLNELRYLAACVDEAMRISPPLPSMLPRTVLSPGLDIDGTHVPAGTIVGVAAYAIHHNEEYFPDSWAFRPERWIADEDDDVAARGGAGAAGVTREAVARARRAFCPFSVGPRNCVGKNVGLLAGRLALARLLWRFEFRMAPAAGEEAGAWSGGGGERLWKSKEAVEEGDAEMGRGEWGRERGGEFQMTDFMVGFRDGPMVQVRRREGVAAL